MKKTAYIVFLSMYLLVTVGVTVAVHFCGGKATSVQMLPLAPKEDPCCCDNATAPDNCCKTEIKSLRLNDDQITVQVNQPSSPQTDVSLWADVLPGRIYSSEAVRLVLPASSPPGSPPTYILHRTLLI